MKIIFLKKAPNNPLSKSLHLLYFTLNTFVIKIFFLPLRSVSWFYFVYTFDVIFHNNPWNLQQGMASELIVDDSLIFNSWKVSRLDSKICKNKIKFPEFFEIFLIFLHFKQFGLNFNG